MSDVLVFAPHPDDDVSGCGGSIIKHVKEGKSVTIVYMTSGDAGSVVYSKEELARIRAKEAQACAAKMGVKNLIFLGYHDGHLEHNGENLVKVVGVIRQVKPSLVYVPHKDDAHKDHVNTNRLVMDAIFFAGGPCFKECGDPWSVDTVLGFEVWTPMAQFSHVEDITEYMEQKIDALMQHTSQVGPTEYHDAMRGLSRYRGVMTDAGKYCECFQVLKLAKL